MKTATTKPVQPNLGDRVIFFDNLRYLFVFGVVLQHASMAYLYSSRWPVADEPSLLVSVFTGFFDGFLMPSLHIRIFCHSFDSQKNNLTIHQRKTQEIGNTLVGMHSFHRPDCASAFIIIRVTA